MAYSEQKASLPPIIEDESDDNLMPMLYKKELGRSNSRCEERSTVNSETQSNSSKVSPSGPPQIPYNSWKSKNAAYLQNPEIGREGSDMVSKLGQRLESCQITLSQQNKHAFFGASPSCQQEFQSIHQVNGSPQIQNRSLPPTSVQQFEERGRYLSSSPSVHDTLQFTSPYNNTGGYFPKNSSVYQDPLYNNQNPLRTITGDFPNHEQFKVAQNSERLYDHTNVPATPLGHHSSVLGSYKYQQMTPNHFQPHMFSNNVQRLGEYQDNYCHSSPSHSGLPSNHHNGLPSNHHNGLPSNHHSGNNQTPQRGSTYRQDSVQSSQQTPCMCRQTSGVKNKNKETKMERRREKQITDLYRIVWLQNQQIMDLQNQVKKLIELYEKSEEKNRKQDVEHAPKILSKGEKRMFNLSVIEENQNLMEKVSVGIMTSFIDTTTVKGNTQNKKAKGKSRRTRKSSTDSSSSSSSSPSSSSETSEEEISPQTIKKNKQKQKKFRKPVEESIQLDGLEIQTVAENPPSPTSMHIELQDYVPSSSDSDDSDSSESEDENPTPVSWTFYDKVVGKVNNILNDSGSDEEDDDDSDGTENKHKKTLEQFRRFGPHMVEPESSPTSKRVTFTSPYLQKPLAESDTSMRMNALAIKYLKEERLSNGYDDPRKIASGIPTNTNLSHATLQYLERNHLVSKPSTCHPFTEVQENSEKTKKPKRKKDKRAEEKVVQKRKSKPQLSGKILDITAIKQQPKLLPKKH